MAHARDLEKFRRHSLATCKGRGREGPGRRYLVWSLGFGFLISSLDGFLIYLELSVLITSRGGYAWLVASDPIESGKPRLGGGRGLPWGSPAASELSPPALDVENAPREVWKGRACPEASGPSGPGCVSPSLGRSWS